MLSQRLAARAVRSGRLFAPTPSLAGRHHLALRSYSAPATIVDAGFWRSLVPKFLRKEHREEMKARKSKDWNPATFFICIFLLIGSMSIQMITLRNSFERYMRQSEVKIGLLREVVERIQRGEKVDVERELGVGEPKKEAEWEEVLRAIEKDEATKKLSRQEKAKRAAAEAQAAADESATKTAQADPAAAKPRTKAVGNFF